MKTIQSTHECFNCKNKFKWQADLFNGNRSGSISTNFGNQFATVCFVEKEKLEVLVSCPKCSNKNKFYYNV